MILVTKTKAGETDQPAKGDAIDVSELGWYRGKDSKTFSPLRKMNSVVVGGKVFFV